MPLLWSFLAGLPLGALVAHALAGGARPALAAGALLGGALLAAAAALLERRDRAGAAAAQAGWAALPALAIAELGAAPGAVGLAVGAVLLVAGSLAAAAAAPPDGRSRPARRALLWLLAGILLAPAAGLAVAALGASQPPLGEDTAAAVYDLDARIAPRPLPRCSAEPRRIEVLLERGAHPRLTRDGAFLWFDAAHQGRRQLHRLSLPGGSPVCWTCDEPGNNRRPAPNDSGRAVWFDSDRHAGPGRPADTELYRISVRGDGPHAPGRRLTYHAGRDDHAVAAPGGGSVLWSRAEGGRFQVVSAGLRTGHGALLLGAPAVVATGGADWIAPLAWSPDARSLALGRGMGGGPVEAEVLDPATGALAPLAAGAAPGGGVAFSADGSRVAVAASAAAGAGPAWLGFLAAARPAAVADAAPAPTRLLAGETAGGLREVPLGEAAAWGGPTGVALGPDGTWLVLGQRSRREGGSRERLLRVTLDCTFD